MSSNKYSSTCSMVSIFLPEVIAVKVLEPGNSGVERTSFSPLASYACASKLCLQHSVVNVHQSVPKGHVKVLANIQETHTGTL